MIRLLGSSSLHVNFPCGRLQFFSYGLLSTFGRDCPCEKLILDISRSSKKFITILECFPRIELRSIKAKWNWVVSAHQFMRNSLNVILPVVPELYVPRMIPLLKFFLAPKPWLIVIFCINKDFFLLECAFSCASTPLCLVSVLKTKLKASQSVKYSFPPKLCYPIFKKA